MVIKLLKKENNDIAEIKRIRKLVFTDELKIPESCVFDELDNTSVQILISNNDTIIGTLRLRKYNDGVKLERMAILPQFRKMSFGTKVIDEVKKFCIMNGESKIFLDAIYDIMDFYKKCGFDKIGKVFERVGIPHIRMEMPI